jgi:outer membrane receptor protein involved in Fe transport
MPRKMLPFAVVAALAFVLALPALVRADITRFDLSGTVTDGTGAVLPGVTVTLKNVDTGATKSTTTDAAGRYRFTAVDPTGRFTLTVELPGFATQHREGLQFQANTKPEIDFRLAVGGVQESITVQASAPLVRTQESELSSILDAKQVDELPTNGRNFLSLLQTSGSVVPLSSSPSSGSLSINGQGQRMTNFLADGVSITGREIRTLNGEFGGGNGLSLDVIKELQVVSNGFKAETGQTGAGTISIVTKSGTNTLSGSAYGFWRPTELVAANLLTGASTTTRRYQYGGTIGGPIKKDVTFYFANYEGTNIHDESVVTSVLAPGTFPAPQTQKQGFFKLNHRFNSQHALDVRYNFNRNTQEGQSVGGLSTYDQRTNTEAHTDSFITSLVSNFGTNKVNEARFRFTYDTVDFYSPFTAPNGPASRTPDFTNAPVTVVYTGVGTLGTNSGFPQNLVEKRAEWVDHFSLIRGPHQMKAGADVIGSWRFVTFFSNFAGTYTFPAGAKYPFNPNDPSTFPTQFTQTFGESGLNYKDAQVGLFFQDDWDVRHNLTLNLGLRWDKDTLFQYDNHSFAPRLGFAWNVNGDAKTVVRGNTGIFYDTLESSMINRESNFGPVGQTTIDLRPGDPLFPTFPNRFSAFPSGTNTVARAQVYVPIFVGDAFPYSIGGPDFHRVAPYFFNTSVGVQHELDPDWAVSADYTRVYGYDLLVTFDINGPPYFPLGPGQTRSVTTANAERPLGVPNMPGGLYNIPFSGFRNLYMQNNGGHTQYNGLKIGLTRRMSRHYAMQVNYTLGKAMGDVDNFRLTGSFVPGLTTIGGDRSYQWGPSDTDVRHVFVVNGTYETVYGIRVGGVLFARSGFPYTGVAGFDYNGDGFSTNSSYGDRPASLTRNSFRYPAIVTLDASVAYDLKLVRTHAVELRFDVFNLTNRYNVASVNNIIGLDASHPPATFGTTTGVGPQRQAQIALRYRF